MKLLIISDAWHPQLNGVVRTLEFTIRELQAMGHEVEITGPEKSLFTFPMPTYPEIKLEFFAGRRLKKILDRFQPDYIHISTEGPLGYAMRSLCLRHRRPFSTAYHTCFPEYVEQRSPFPLRNTTKLITYQIMKWFHAPSGCVMVATPTLESLLRKRRIKRLKRWSRGVDVGLFHPRACERLREPQSEPQKNKSENCPAYEGLARPLSLHVGRVAVEKNLEAFLALDLPGTKVIIGDGPDMESLKKKYPGIRFLGRKTGEDLARHYAGADVFVFPSKTDTFGLVILEALASGLPIAAYPVQGPRDILAMPEARRVSVLDDDLRTAVLGALALKADPQTCHDFAATHYSWGACTRQFIDNLQATTPFALRRLGRFSVALDFLQMLWRRIRTLPKFYPNIYRTFSMVLEPLLPIYLNHRARHGKEDPERLPERFGHASVKRPLGKLIWCHGASVGEGLSLLPLLERLEAHPARPSILLTTGTRSSAEVLKKRLPPNIIHQYVPVDTLPATERFMAYWRPDFAIVTESELWPNLIGKLRRHAVSAALVNARMSAESAQRWENFAGLWIAALLRVFNLVLAQTEADAVRLRTLGAYGAKSVGNLKATAAPLPVNEANLAAFKESLGKRPIWLIASTHEGEEEIALRAAAVLQKSYTDLLTIIVPRHPERAEKIMALCKAQNMETLRRSERALPEEKTSVYIADTLGEMGLFYRLAPVAVIGGSFTQVGGHNPVEAAAFGCAILFGPDMRNFSEIARDMVQQGAAQQVAHEEELQKELFTLLGGAGNDMRLRARAFTARQHEVLEHIMAELRPFLDEALK
ncbi:MAG: glycosyltransferase [Proteobacteria bacterium]|nr:glycosyltransferase [Pseudomonadota bacterium]